MATTLENRLDALEQAAKASAVRSKPKIGMDFEAMRQRLEMLANEKGPELTQAEQIQKFKDDITRMNARWELQRGGK